MRSVLFIIAISLSEIAETFRKVKIMPDMDRTTIGIIFLIFIVFFCMGVIELMKG